MALTNRSRVRKAAVLVGLDNDTKDRDPGDQAPHVEEDHHVPPDVGDPGQLAPLPHDPHVHP
jgi:hypothetical protein